MADGCAGALVIGFGNELRRDDAAGRRVAEAVDRRALAGVTVVTATQLVPELVERIAEAELVVFVDASVDAREVVVRPVPAEATSAVSHHATPAALLGLLASLGMRCPSAFVVEVPASDVSLGEGLTDAARTAVDVAADEVLELIAA